MAVGFWLIFTHRYHGIGVIFHSYGAGHGHYVSAFLAASLIGIFQYYGFEPAAMWPRRCPTRAS